METSQTHPRRWEEQNKRHQSQVKRELEARRGQRSQEEGDRRAVTQDGSRVTEKREAGHWLVRDRDELAKGAGRKQ